MVKLRLKRMGSKYNAFYRIVAADSRSPRDGKYIEELGFYNPHTKEIRVNLESKNKWISQGAQPSETVKKLFAKFEKMESKDTVVTLPKKAKKVAPEIIEEAEVKAEAPVEQEASVKVAE